MDGCKECLYTGCSKRADGIRCGYFKDKKKTVEHIKDEINKKAKRDIRDKKKAKESSLPSSVI